MAATIEVLFPAAYKELRQSVGLPSPDVNYESQNTVVLLFSYCNFIDGWFQWNT